MSWNTFGYDDINPETRETPFYIILCWTCPRCEKIQTVSISKDDITSGADVACENTAICGEGQSHFEIATDNIWGDYFLTVGSYKGLMDRPLDTPRGKPV